MSTPDQQQIAKLPKWAQEHIESLTRQREEAVKTLNLFADEQTESGVWVEDHPCIGESGGPTWKRRYIQTREIHVKHAGVYLTVFLSREDDRQRCFGIQLQWQGKHTCDNGVAMIPRSYMKVELIAKENMQ